MGGYVLRICCCALICGALGTIGGSCGSRKVIYGLFLAFSIISPLRQIELKDFYQLPETLYEEGMEISQAAALGAEEELEAVIKEQLASYILVKADSLGVGIGVVSITLDPASMEPVGVTLSGDISPYNRQLLGQYLQEELGIRKEHLTWSLGA